MKAHAEFETDRICLEFKDEDTVLLMEAPHSFNKFTNGIVNKAQILLTLEEAESMAQDILNAAQMLRTMLKECELYFEQAEGPPLPEA